MNWSGFYAIVTAYVCWGIIPIYYRSIEFATPKEILAHRIIWTVMFLMIFLAVSRMHGNRIVALTTKQLLGLLATSILIGFNWYVFIVAIAHRQTVEASLGYFINPMLFMLVGVIFWRERLSRLQKAGLALTALGIGHEVIAFGQPPWIALGLAASFAAYGALKKRLKVHAAVGLLVEAAYLLPLAIGYVAYLHAQDQFAMAHSDIDGKVLLVSAGVITSVPLVLFAFGAQSVPFYYLGIMQYISPTLQFLTAVFIFGEPLLENKLISFACVWLGLACACIHVLANYQARKHESQFNDIG